MRVKDVMTTDVRCINESTTIQDAANEMKNLNVGSMPVCDSNDKILGIVTDRDIVINGLTQGLQSSDTVSKVMTINPVTVTPDTSMEDATNLMSQNQIRRLPVVNEGKVVGIVSIGDIAVRDRLVDKAGNALSDISEPSRPNI